LHEINPTYHGDDLNYWNQKEVNTNWKETQPSVLQHIEQHNISNHENTNPLRLKSRKHVVLIKGSGVLGS